MYFAQLLGAWLEHGGAYIGKVLKNHVSESSKAIRARIYGFVARSYAVISTCEFGVGKGE